MGAFSSRFFPVHSSWHGLQGTVQLEARLRSAARRAIVTGVMRCAPAHLRRQQRRQGGRQRVPVVPQQLLARQGLQIDQVLLPHLRQNGVVAVCSCRRSLGVSSTGCSSVTARRSESYIGFHR